MDSSVCGLSHYSKCPPYMTPAGVPSRYPAVMMGGVIDSQLEVAAYGLTRCNWISE
jgi:hypothetical protein